MSLAPSVVPVQYLSQVPEPDKRVRGPSSCDGCRDPTGLHLHYVKYIAPEHVKASSRTSRDTLARLQDQPNVRPSSPSRNTPHNLRHERTIAATAWRATTRPSHLRLDSSVSARLATHGRRRFRRGLRHATPLPTRASRQRSAVLSSLYLTVNPT